MTYCRVVKETIRLTELLLAVLIDGHEAMRSRRALPTVRSGSAPAAAGGESEQRKRQRAPQATAPSRGGHVSAHVVPPEFQRRIIDSIRNKDTRTLLDSIENGCMCSVVVVVMLQPRHVFTSASIVNMSVAMCDTRIHALLVSVFLLL